MSDAPGAFHEDKIPGSVLGKAYVLAIITLAVVGLTLAEVIDRFRWLGDALRVALAVTVTAVLFYLMLAP